MIKFYEKELQKESFKSLLAFICAYSRIPYLQYEELSKEFLIQDQVFMNDDHPILFFE